METKLKFKAGYRVRVKSMEWYDFNKDVCGDICNNTWHVFVRDMAQYCGKVLTIAKLKSDFYVVEENIFSWQDWMLEDEVVTEEKQEVEQLNKNIMETKKMTLQEAQEFVKNTKYIVWSEDESRQLQKKLFEIGCGWFCGGPIVSHTEHPFLLVDYNLRLSYASKESYKCFEESQKEHQLKDDVLNIQIIEEPKPKFDPNTLQPFDKVLVKDGGGWRCDYFSHIDEVNERYPFICVGSCWRFGIPYNDETKHLLGTQDEAPEFYRLD